MKFDKWIVVYLVIVGLLLLGIAGLWLKRRNSMSTMDFVKTGDNTKEVSLINEAGKPEILKGVTGKVVSWDGNEDILAVTIDGAERRYQIDANNTKVMIGLTQNRFGNPTLNALNKKQQPLHWQSAFCKDDVINIMFNIKDQIISQIIDSDYRPCGFKGAFR